MIVPDPRDQPTMTVEQAGACFGLSRSAAYAAVAAGQFPAPLLRVGRKIIVPTAGVRRALLLDVDPEHDEAPSGNGASVSTLASGQQGGRRGAG